MLHSSTLCWLTLIASTYAELSTPLPTCTEDKWGANCSNPDHRQICVVSAGSNLGGIIPRSVCASISMLPSLIGPGDYCGRCSYDEEFIINSIFPSQIPSTSPSTYAFYPSSTGLSDVASLAPSKRSSGLLVPTMQPSSLINHDLLNGSTLSSTPSLTPSDVPSQIPSQMTSESINPSIILSSLPSNVPSDKPSVSPFTSYQTSEYHLTDSANALESPDSNYPTILRKTNQPNFEADSQHESSIPFPSTSISGTFSPPFETMSLNPSMNSLNGTPSALPSALQSIEGPFPTNSSEMSLLPTYLTTAQPIWLIKTNPPKYEFENVIATYYLSLETVNELVFSESDVQLIKETVRDFLNFKWPYDAAQRTAIVGVDVKSQSILSKSNRQLLRRQLQIRNVVNLALVITGVTSLDLSAPIDFSNEVNTVFESEKLVLIYMLAEKGIVVTIPFS